MKFLIVIPDGVGIRNFLCTRFIGTLLEAGEVVVWHALSELTLAPHKARWGDRIRWQPLPHAREGLTERVLRQAKVYAQLYWTGEEGDRELLRLLRPNGRLVSRTVGHSARGVGRLAAGRRRLAALDRLHARAAGGDARLAPFLAFLREERPDVLFCTHQRASRAVPAVLAARKLGIPAATFIYSWDNLPKGRMATHPDHFVVWSDFMKEELQGYYPEVPPERIHVAGTPQFEPYLDASLIRPREEFLGELGLDPARATACFSGDDFSTSPYDPEYLADLAAGLRQVPAERRPQILFRRCPVDRSDRYDAVLEKFPEIAVSDPLWTAADGDWSQVVPTFGDVALLANVVHHCDVVVNLASTMGMDFAVLDKPGVYVNYEPKQRKASDAWSAAGIYRLTHFRGVHELEPCYWAYSAEELAPIVMHALAHPGEKTRERRAWLERHVRLPLTGFSERCCEVLTSLAN